MKKLIAYSLSFALLIPAITLNAQNCTLADKPKDEVCAQKDQIGYLEAYLLRILARDLTDLERSLAKSFDEFNWRFVAKISASHIVGKVAKRVLSMNNPTLITALQAGTFWVGDYMAADKKSSEWLSLEAFGLIPAAKVSEQPMSERERLFLMSSQSALLHRSSVTVREFFRETAQRTQDGLIQVGTAAASAFVSSAPYLALSAITITIGMVSRATYQQIVAVQNLVGQHAVPDIRPFLGLDEEGCAVCFLIFGDDACFRYLRLPCRHAQLCQTCMTQIHACPVCRAPG